MYKITLQLFRAMSCLCDVLQEDIKTLITYLVEKHFSAFEGVTYVQTFKALRQRYDQRAERSVMADRSSVNLLKKPRPRLSGHAPVLTSTRNALSWLTGHLSIS